MVIHIFFLHNMADIMDVDPPKLENENGEISLLKNRIQMLENQVTQFVKEIDNKNEQIESVNQNYFNVLKENDILKCDISNVTEISQSSQNEIVQLRRLLLDTNTTDENNMPVDLSSQSTTDNKNKRVLLQSKVNNLLEELDKKTSELQTNRKENLIERIDKLSKLQHTNSQLTVLREKNEISQKFIDSNDEYIAQLVKYIDNLKGNYSTLELSFRDEIRSLTELAQVTDQKNVALAKQNKSYENHITVANEHNKKLTNSLAELQRQYQQLKQDHDTNLVNFQTEKDSLSSEINNLNDLLKKSKNDIMDKYLEKYYPNIASISQMFNSKMSISELYSLYLEFKNKSEDYEIENKVLHERIETMDVEIENMKYIIEKNDEEIKIIDNLQNTILRYENDKKESDISKHFYKESAQTLHKGYKTFNEDFINLADKIKSLVQRETSQVTEDSTSMRALTYIMELQNRFQEFNKLHSDFEKRKLDFINEKQNIIESDKQMDLLKSQVMILETEKRQMNSNYELLKQEYSMLQTLYQSYKAKCDAENAELKAANQELNQKISILSTQHDTIDTTIKNFEIEIANLKQDKDNLETKINKQMKDNSFSNQRLEIQNKLMAQMEKSLEQMRRQNSNLNTINQQLDTNLKLVNQKFSESNSKILDLQSQVLNLKFAVDIYQKKEANLIKQLNDNNKESARHEDIGELFKSLRENSLTLESSLLKNFESIKVEKENLDRLLEQKQKHWQEEKIQLESKVVELQDLFKGETVKLNTLQEEYSKLNEIKSAISLDENSSVDENLKTQNTLLKSQTEEYERQIKELSSSLNEFKQKYLDNNQETIRLLEVKNVLESKIESLNNDKSALNVQLNCLQQYIDSKNSSFERLQKSLTENSEIIEKKNMDLTEKTVACELHLKQIQQLNQSVIDLDSRLKQSITSEMSCKQQIEIYKQTNTQLQANCDMELKKHSDDFQTIVGLRKKIGEFQTRFAELETVRLKQEEELTNELNTVSSDYEQLKKSNEQLYTTLNNLKVLHQSLCAQINETSSKLINDPAFLSKRDHLFDLQTLNDIIENVCNENKVLMAKCKSLQTKESRLINEVEHHKKNAKNLEQCLETEKQNFFNLKQFSDSKNNLEQIKFMSDCIQNLQTAKDSLEKECSLFKHTIAQLQSKLNSSDNDNLIKTANSYKVEIDSLKLQLNSNANQIEQLNRKFQSEEERSKKLESELKQSLIKIENQTSQIDNLQTELASAASNNQKCQNELTNIKQTVLLSSDENSKLKSQLESLRTEITSIQNMNQQLRVLARKYKSQCDEHQKNYNKLLEDQKNDQKTSASDNTEAINAKELEIKELNAKVDALAVEIEKLKSDISKLNVDNENLQRQVNEKDQQAKKIAQQARQKLSEKNQLIQTLQNRVNLIKSSNTTVHRDESTISMSSVPSSSGQQQQSLKMPVSSAFVSASSLLPSTSTSDLSSVSTNIQPSSSNEDIVTLQSAHITSHSTSIDDNSVESFSNIQNQVADSNVSSNNNKRGLSSNNNSDSEPELTKKRRANVENDDDDEDISNQSVVNVEDDDESNEVSDARDNYSQSSNDANPVINLQIEEDNNVEYDNFDENDDTQVEEEEVVEVEAEPSAPAAQSYDDDNASSSQPNLTRPNSIDFGYSVTASTSGVVAFVDSQLQPTQQPQQVEQQLYIDPMLMQPGPSNVGPSTSSTSSTVSTNLVHNPVTLNVVPQHQHHQLSVISHSSSTSSRNFELSNTPHLIIPQANMLSPPNPINTPSLGSGCADEGERIVPSTPILYVHRFEDTTISPQVPQSRFVFSNQQQHGGHNFPTTPTISETVSSVINIDRPDADYLDHDPEMGHSRSPNNSRTDEEQDDGLISTTPSSSSAQNEPTNSDNQQSSNPTRGRRLRIRGSSRGRF